jgi:adenylate cyclase class 2
MESYQETTRESWELDGAQIELDVWPWIRPFIEIEAGDEQTVRAIADKLDLDWQDAQHGSVEIVYMHEYDVTEEEVDAWPEITFAPVPDWLENKRRS